MENDIKINERRHKKNGRQPKKNGRQPKKKLKINGRRPQKIIKMEDDLKHNLKKSTLIGCDIIVN